MESPQCVSRFPQALRRPKLKNERCTKLHDMCLAKLVSMVQCGASGGQATLEGQQPDTDEAVPSIGFGFADLGREEDQVLPIPSLNAVDVGSESLSATLCPTKAFSEYLVETILAFVAALGHYVVMLHSDQERVLVQLLKVVQS